MRHWLLVLIGIALLGGTLWRLWPRHPYDITKVETKQYRNEACGLEMKIPMDWEVLSWQTSKKLLDEIDDEGLSPEQERKRVEFFLRFWNLASISSFATMTNRIPTA